jgi:hypothetical protein
MMGYVLWDLFNWISYANKKKTLKIYTTNELWLRLSMTRPDSVMHSRVVQRLLASDDRLCPLGLVQLNLVCQQEQKFEDLHHEYALASAFNDSSRFGNALWSTISLESLSVRGWRRPTSKPLLRYAHKSTSWTGFKKERSHVWAVKDSLASVITADQSTDV